MPHPETTQSPIRIMLVDDSAVIRGLMTRELKEDPLFHVVASASNGVMALQILRNETVDVILLDIEMPEMDGITALPKLLQTKPDVKIIMVSTLSERGAEISMKALALGATDCIAKPSSRNDKQVTDRFYAEVKERIRAIVGNKRAAASVVSSPVEKPTAPPASPSVSEPLPIQKVQQPHPAQGAIFALPNHSIQAVAIGCSTGGPQALLQIFGCIKNTLSHIPIFITQHMPPTFTTILADHLARTSGKPCAEAKQGEVVKAGNVYVAPGDFHMTVDRVNGIPTIHLNQNPPVNFCRPSVDPMLDSLVTVYGSGLLVAILTGMGQDGLDGCKKAHLVGATIVAQDESSCVVYGMPKAIIDNRLAKSILPISEIGTFLIKSGEVR
jgi:two-component system chemotaxis response regulator CheB